MLVNRILLPVVLLSAALVLQVSALARLQLPGAVPDLTMLIVVALAIVYGPTGGCLVGFAAGLLTDLAPPSAHAAGRFALVLCLIGYLAGLVKPENGQLRSIAKPMFVVAAAAVASTLLHAGVGSLVGDTAARNVGLTGLTLSALLYDLLLAPFVVPWVMALTRRLERDPVAAASESSQTRTAAPGWLSSANGRGSRFTTTGRLSGTGKLSKNGRPRAGFFRMGPRPTRTPLSGQRSGVGRSIPRSLLGRSGRRP